MREAQGKIDDPNLKGNKLYSAEAQRRLYQFRVQALQVELEAAEAARVAILRVAQSGTK
jgi:hypothetical protein